MPYCEKCGETVNSQANFCRNCGKPQTQDNLKSFFSSGSQNNKSVDKSLITQKEKGLEEKGENNLQDYEKIIHVMPIKKPKSLGRSDCYTAIITTKKIIFAKITNEMLKEEINNAREKAKSAGKGFFSQWSEQMKASMNYAQKYFLMEPKQILEEHPENFQVYNIELNEIKIRQKNTSDHYENYKSEYELEIKSNKGKYKFKMEESVDNIKKLKETYGEKIRTNFKISSHKFNIKF